MMLQNETQLLIGLEWAADTQGYFNVGLNPFNLWQGDAMTAQEVK